MPCQEIRKWTFSALVGAFLDLAITYLLLGASTVTFVASKFLGLFGLSLPCPCNGRFGDPRRSSTSKCCCWQRVLVNRPSEKLSSIRFSIKSKFPFDSILDQNANVKPSVGLIRDGKGGFNVKGRMARFDRRRRRKGAAGDGSVQLDTLSEVPAAVGDLVNTSGEVSGAPINGVTNDSALSSTEVGLSIGPAVASKLLFGETKQTEGDVLGVAKYDNRPEIFFDGDERTTIRVLEQALEDEHAAHVVLYLELEKERSSAATAADETMAMILRLQEEKAVIEMEAKQFQRMMEEKSAYDSEEMSILKDILLRREREKHFLEKEVETYRTMVSGVEQLDFDIEGTITTPTNMPTDAEDMQENMEIISGYDVQHIESPSHGFSVGRQLHVPELDEADYLGKGCLGAVKKFHEHMPTDYEEFDKEPQDKDLVLPGMGPCDQEKVIQKPETYSQLDLSTTQGHDLHGKTITCEGEVQQQHGAMIASQVISDRTDAFDHTKISFPCNHDYAVMHGKDTVGTVFDMGPYMHDVHVVDDMCNVKSEASANGKEQLLTNSAFDVPSSSDSPVFGKLESREEIIRSSSDIGIGLPPKSHSGPRQRFSDLRRNSMSAVDYERFKIDGEVGLLRKQLKIVQEGREKLKTSIGHRDKDKSWLQVKVNYLQGALESTIPVSEVLLTPPFGKAALKRRHWRTVSFKRS